MAHGAAPCQNAADFIVTEPSDVIALKHRYGPLLLGGSKTIANEVVRYAAFLAGFAYEATWSTNFQLLPRGFMYEELWSPGKMQLFTSCVWIPTNLLCAFAIYFQPELDHQLYHFGSGGLVTVLFLYFVFGFFMSFVWPEDQAQEMGESGRYGEYALSIICFFTLSRQLVRYASRKAADGKWAKLVIWALRVVLVIFIVVLVYRKRYLCEILWKIGTNYATNYDIVLKWQNATKKGE
jgi:hypothetical protein